MDDETKESPIEIAELESTELEFETSGVYIDNLTPLISEACVEEGTELGGREEVMLVDTDCVGVDTTEDVKDLVPNTELRTGDGCGTGVGCDGVGAVNIAGGVVMDIDAMDDTKSDIHVLMFSVSAKEDKQNTFLRRLMI